MVNAELNCKCELLSSYWAVSLSWRSWFWWETCSVKFGIVFFSGKEDPPAEEESHTSRFPFVFTEIWRQYGLITVTSPSCNCFSMDSCARQDRNPASLLFFPLYNYPSKAVARPTDHQTVPAPAWKEILQGDFEEVGMQVQPGHSPATPQQKIPAPPRLHWRNPWVLPTPVTLSCPRGALLTTLAFQTATLPFNCRPLPGAIPSWQLICSFKVNLTAAFLF